PRRPGSSGTRGVGVTEGMGKRGAGIAEGFRAAAASGLAGMDVRVWGRGTVEMLLPAVGRGGTRGVGRLTSSGPCAPAIGSDDGRTASVGVGRGGGVGCRGAGPSSSAEVVGRGSPVGLGGAGVSVPTRRPPAIGAEVVPSVPRAAVLAVAAPFVAIPFV